MMIKKIKIKVTSKNVIARSEATKQSLLSVQKLDCFATLAMTNQMFRATLKKEKVKIMDSRLRGNDIIYGNDIICSNGNYRQRGSALLVVLGVVMVVTILSFAYISRSDTELACGDNMLSYVKTDYLAQSGLEHAKGLILNPQEIPDEYWQGADGVSIEGNSSFYYDVNVAVEQDSSLPGGIQWCNYKITSEGYNLSGSERKAQTSLQAILRLDPAIALWSGSILQTQLGNNFTINGDAYFKGNLNGDGNIYGDVFCDGTLSPETSETITGQKKQCSELSLEWPEINAAGFESEYTFESVSSPLSGPVSGNYLKCDDVNDFEITGDVVINGMLIVNRNLVVEGTNNRIIAQKNLPALLIDGDLTIAQNAQLDIEGLAIVKGKVIMDSGAGHLNVLGGLFTRGGIEDGQRNITITAAPAKTAVYVTAAGGPKKWSQAPTAFYKDIRRN